MRRKTEIIYNDVYSDRPKVEVWVTTPKRGRVQVYQTNETYVLPDFINNYLSFSQVQVIHNY